MHHHFRGSLLVFLALSGSAAAQDAFLDKLSAAPGETVQVHVRSSQPYEVRVLRSFYFQNNQLMVESALLPAQSQSSPIGSYAYVDDDPALDITGAITLEAWVKPVFIPNPRFAGILSKYGRPNQTAYALHLMPNGEVSFELSETGKYSLSNRMLTTHPLPVDVWTHVVATYDGQTKRIYLDGQLDVTQARRGPIFDSSEPVKVGAFGGGSFFDGTIDSPVIYDRALSAAEVGQRFQELAQYGPGNPGVLPGAVAQWNFDEMEGTTLADATGNGHDLELVNWGTRSTPGPLPPGASGMPSNWAIKFHSDDGYNPPWVPTWSFTVQPSWSPGFYQVLVLGENSSEWRMPFIVKPADPSQSPAEIAVLANSNTWAAYNGWSNSLYDTHPGTNQINVYVGLLQPMGNARLNLQTPGNGFSPRVDAERYLYKWLDDHGYAFDLYTDLDLHKSPELLSNYRVFMTNGHSEYWSTEEVDHVEAFQNAGGYVVNLSGNTMWTVVSYDRSLTVMEGRKHPWSSFPSIFPPEERWHSTGGQVLGGTWRCAGRPEHNVLGTGYGVYFAGGQFGAYSVLDPSHWVFAGTGVQQGTLVGTTSLNGNAILGHEVDEVEELLSPANVKVLARGGPNNNPSFRLNIRNCNVREQQRPVVQGGDMVYWDHPGGGAVFGAPTIAFGGSVMVDPVVSKILENVLERFLNAATCTFRNGSGVNPIGFDCTTMPVVGTTWTSSVATTPTTTSTLLGLSASPARTPLFGLEFLIGLVPEPLFQQGNGTHSIPIPNLANLLGASLYSQGFRFEQPGGNPTVVLLNAQDLTLGR